MGYVENIKSIMQWGNSFERQGNFPLDRTDLHISYEDAVLYAKGDGSDSRKLGKLAYIGQTITVWGLNEKGKEGVWVYSLVPHTPADETDTILADLQPVGSGNGSMQVETLTIVDNKVEEASADNVGQVIYVTKGTEEYPAGPYIVTGEGEVAKLGTTTATGDIAGDVNILKGKVSTLEETVGDDSKGLVKNVADITTKLDTIAEGAEVNYVKSVGDNLNVDESGNLTVSIPEAVFKLVAENDKVLKLNSGVLSSTLSYGREEVEGVDSLVLKGLNDEVIGSVPVADFLADGMLKSVEELIDGDGKTTGKFRFTFNVDKDGVEGEDYFDVDFSKYIDTYKADGTTLELDSTTNTFKVKDGVFEAAGAAAGVQTAIETKLNDYALVANVYSKETADNTFVKAAGYVAYTQDEKTKLANIAEGAEVNVVKEVDTAGVLELNEAGKLSIDLTDYALTANVNSSLDNKVDKVDGKGLSTNDFTDDLKAKLENVEAGAQVNVVKSVVTGEELKLSEAGALSVDLSAYAKSENVNSALATKLDVSAKVNGVSFVDGVATLDAGDITLEAAITSGTSDGSSIEQYPISTTVQSVLQSLNNRITAAVSGGLTSVAAGDGISVTAVVGNSQTVSIKKSTEENNMLELKTDGIYVQDMRSYWEGI